MATKNKIQQSNKPAKKSRKTNVLHENLLLAYTYYLNEKQTCKIIIGFDCDTFQSKIVFHRNGKKPVEVFYYDWYSYYNKTKQLEAVQNNNESQLIEIEPFCNILQFNQQDNKIFDIQQEEYWKLIGMLDFIQAVMSYNNNASNNVEAYIHKYFTKCKEQGVIKLSQEQFYIPMQFSPNQCNYSRLFYEVPLFMTHKLFSYVYDVHTSINEDSEICNINVITNK